MPAVIEAGVDLVLVACVLLLIGMLMAIKYTLTPFVLVLDVGILGYHPFKGIANTVRNTVLNWCTEGINSMVRVLADLYHGLAWAIRWQINALARFAHAVDHSFDLLWRHAIKGIATGLVKEAEHLAHLAEAQLLALVKTAEKDVTKLAGTVEKDIAKALSTAEKYAVTEATKAAKAVEGEALALIHGLTATVDDLASQLRSGLDSVIGTIGEEVSAAEKYAAAQAEAALRAAEGEVSDAVKSLDDLIAAGLAGVEGEIAALGIPSLATLAASVATLTATVALVLAESGLDNPTCRSKVKGICGTDLTSWLAALAGLALFGGIPSLKDLVDTGTAVVGEARSSIESFAKAA